LTVRQQLREQTNGGVRFHIRSAAAFLREHRQKLVCRFLRLLDKAYPVLTDRKDDCLSRGGEISFLLDKDTLVLVIPVPADEKCAPDRTHDVDRAGSAVDRFRAKHLVQMI